MIMTQNEKINYLRISLAMQQIAVNNQIADQIIQTYEAVLGKKGTFTLHDAVDIEIGVERKYKNKKTNEKK